jgi:hypothetical protein
MVAAESRCGAGRVGSDPIRRKGSLARLPDQRDVARRLRVYGSSAERRPLLHQPAPLLEHAGREDLLHLAPYNLAKTAVSRLTLSAAVEINLSPAPGRLSG